MEKELIKLFQEAREWAEKSKIKIDGEINWEAVNHCNKIKKKARLLLEAILSEIET